MKFLIILFYSTYTFSQEGELSQRLKRCLTTNITKGLSIKIVGENIFKGKRTNVYFIEIKTDSENHLGMALIKSKDFNVGDTITDTFFLEYAEKATIYDGFYDGISRKVLPVMESEACKSYYLTLQENINTSDNQKSFPILEESVMKQLVQMVKDRHK